MISPVPAIRPSRVGLAALLLTVAVPLAFGASGRRPIPASGTPARPEQGDFSDFLLFRDLVITGTVVRSEDVMHAHSGGCGASNLPPIRGHLVTVRPDRVIVGSLEAATIQVFAYDESADDPNAANPGDSVLAFGIRPCDDPGTLWGDAVPIAADGALRAPAGVNVQLVSTPPGGAPRLSEVLAAVELKRERRADVAFEGASGAALVRVESVVPALPHGYTAAFQLVRWVAGAPSALPASMRFWPSPRCEGPVAGDTLLLPVVAGAREARWCPGRLIVRDGRVPALSVPLARVGEVLAPGPAGLRVVHDRRRK